MYINVSVAHNIGWRTSPRDIELNRAATYRLVSDLAAKLLEACIGNIEKDYDPSTGVLHHSLRLHVMTKDEAEVLSEWIHEAHTRVPATSLESAMKQRGVHSYRVATRGAVEGRRDEHE